MTSKSTKTNRVKEAALQYTVDPTGSARVTISLDASLLKMIDRYANRNELSRSAVFEKALMQWYETLQEEADREFYSAEAKDPAVRDWSKVSSKSISYLWND